MIVSEGEGKSSLASSKENAVGCGNKRVRVSVGGAEGDRRSDEMDTRGGGEADYLGARGGIGSWRIFLVHFSASF